MVSGGRELAQCLAPGTPNRPASGHSTSPPVSALPPRPPPRHGLWLWLLTQVGGSWPHSGGSTGLVSGQHHLTCALGLNLHCQLNCSSWGAATLDQEQP